MRKLLLFCAALCCAFSVAAQADYPSRPIRFVLVASAGGGGDAIARLLAERMAPIVGGSFYIDNKPGAGGALATEIVAKAPADGHTILLGSYTASVLMPTVNKKLAYDAINDFAPIGRIGTASILFVTTNDFPANTLREFIALAKSRPDLQYASWGNASTGHFCGELLAQSQKLKLSHIAYKTAGQIHNDLLGGHIQLAFVDMASGTPFVKSGRLKALGACTARTPNFPELVSFEDEGIAYSKKPVTAPMWTMYAPAKTPPAVLGKLEAALRQVLEAQDIQQRLLDLGVTVDFMPGAQVKKEIASSIEGWRHIATTANMAEH